MKQRTRRIIGVVAALLLFLSAGATTNASAQGTDFTYQGRLQDSGANANGNYDFQFTLWDALTGGTQQPQPTPVTVTKSSVAVASGVFTVQLDFGATAFPGADRWLETSVRLAGAGAFIVLSPRQPITATPYAVRSASSSSADVAATATNATQLGGVAANQYVVTTDARMSDPRAPTAGSANYIQNTASQQVSSNFNISGNGTAGGTLSGNIVNAATQYSISGNRVLTAGNIFSAVGQNVFVGFGSGQANTNGSFNAYFGSSAGAHGNACCNSMFGDSAGVKNTTGQYNSFFGTSSGSSNTIESSNTFVGAFTDGALGIQNSTALGYNTVVTQSNSLVLGNNVNVGIGTTAPAVPLEVRRNSTVASNWQTGQLRISGATDPNMQLNLGYDTSSNVGVIQAGQANTSYRNLLLNPFGGNVTIGPIDAISGISKLYAIAGNNQYGVVGSATNLSGVSGTATTGDGVSGISTSGRGVYGSSSNGTGVYGTSSSTFGVNGSASVASQTFNAAYVGAAGIWGTSQSSVGVFGTSDSNVGVVGVSQSNIGVLGRSTSGNAGYFDGTVVVATLATGPGSTVCRNSSNQLSSCSSSSLRYKKDISRFGSGLDVINRLKPIAFTWKSDGTRDFGLGAEDVEKVDPSLVFYRDGRIEGVKYDRIGVVLINAVKEQQAQIAQQKKALEHQQELIKQQTEQFRQQSAMVTAQQQQIEALKKLVCRSNRRAVVCR